MHIVISNKKLKRKLTILNVGNGWNTIAAHVLSADTTNDATTTTGKHLCPHNSTIESMSPHDVCIYCLHPKNQHVYYVGQIDNKHTCRVCDCLYFKSM